MQHTEEEDDLTGPVVSEPQGPAGVGGIVPAPSPSSSDVGLPSGSAGSSGGDTTISVLAAGLQRSVPGLGKGGEKGPVRRSTRQDSGAQASPAPATPGPSTSRAADEEACFKRPGPKSSKRKRVGPTAPEAVASTGDEGSSGEASEGGSDMSLSGFSSDTENASSQGGASTGKRGRGRPASTGVWVGVEGVRQELELLKKELERVKEERDILGARFEVDFGPTAGGLPSSYDVMRELDNETVDSLINVVIEEMESVERVAERSKSLKGTLTRRLRAATRRALAASKLLFTRATISAGEQTERGALERTRRELEAAKGLFEEAQEKVRRLEGEVELLKAKETLRASRAERVLPSPCPTPPLGGECGIEAMETEMEGPPVLREDPPPPVSVRREPLGDPAASQDLLVERIAVRVAEMLRLRREDAARPTEPPQPPPEEGRELWSKVVGRKARKTRGKAGDSSRKTAPPPATGGKGESGGRKKKKGPKKGTEGAPVGKVPPQKKKRAGAPAGVVREPRTAAVLVTVAPGAGTTAAEALRIARPASDVLEGTGTVVSLKRAQAGGTLIQLSGGEGPRLAEELVAKMRQALEGKPGVRVTRPQKRAELRLQGLDDSVTRQEVVEAVTGLTDCRAEDLAVGEIKFLPNRLGSVWLRCPVSVYNKVVEARRLRIGWGVVTVRPLAARRMRCFRCLEVGHGAAGCKGPDRSGRCHRCGDRSHQSRLCPSAAPKCPLCADLGLPDGHSLGAATCVPSARVACRRKAALAKKATEEGKGPGTRSSTKEGAAPAASGGGSKGGPRRAKPPETSAPAGPAGAERGTRPRADKGPSSGASEKGSTDGGEGRSAGSSLKRTMADRSSAAQRERARAALGGEDSHKENSPTPPPPQQKKKKDYMERFKN